MYACAKEQSTRKRNADFASFLFQHSTFGASLSMSGNNLTAPACIQAFIQHAATSLLIDSYRAFDAS